MSKKIKVCHVLPTLFACGGNRICVEHLNRLNKDKFESYYTVINNGIVDSKNWLNLSNIKHIHLSKDELELMDIVIVNESTGYSIVKNMELVNPELIHFLQSIEWMFVAEDKKQTVFDSILDVQFKLMTEAKWIKNLIYRDFGRDCYLIPNMLEIPDIDFQTIERTKPVILIEGRPDQYKGIFAGLDALRNLKDECEIWWLTNGKGYLHNHYEKVIDKTFESVSWEDALNVIRNADILLKPSLIEGQSGVIMEAFALGTPVVTTDIEGTYELVIDRWNGLMFPPRNSLVMENKIRLLLEDTELYNKIITNGLKTAEKYSDWNKSISKLENILTELCNKNVNIIHKQKYAIMQYPNTFNIGDDIQSIAAEQFLPRVDYLITRDNIGRFDKNCKMLLNGFFMHESQFQNYKGFDFPPKKNINALVTSFHIDTPSILNVEYFKKHEPVGCRDFHTLNIMMDAGINAYFSGCMTLTLKRPNIERTDEVFCVDVGREYQGIHVTHYTKETNYYKRRETALDLLGKYARAKKVITSRLHCYLPCIAFGTPVELVAYEKKRFDGLVNRDDYKMLAEKIENRVREFIEKE